MFVRIRHIEKEGDVGPYLSQISDQRRAKVLAFRHRAGQWQSLQAYLLLKEMLAEHYGIEENPVFVVGENGKPSIEGHPEIHFNISHCACAVACVLDDKPVGIDVERIPSTLKEDLCRYVFNEEECNAIFASAHPETEFARFWTMKESLVKLTGTGLRGKEQLQPLLEHYRHCISIGIEPPYRFTNEVHEEDGFVASICY